MTHPDDEAHGPAPATRPAGHPDTCLCAWCLAADMDVHLVAQGQQPLGSGGDLFVRVPPVPTPRASRPREASKKWDVAPPDPVDTSGPVLLHVEDVAPRMFLRVCGIDPTGAPVDVTGFIGWPYDTDGLVAVPVADVPEGPHTVVLVGPNAHLELREAPYELAERAARMGANVGDPYRLTVEWDYPDRTVPILTQTHDVTTLTQVDTLLRRHHHDGRRLASSALYALNWRGQR